MTSKYVLAQIRHYFSEILNGEGETTRIFHERVLLELLLWFSSIDDDHLFTGWLNVYEGS